MPEMEEPKTSESTQRSITRRRFILGVIAGGAVVGAASYKILAPGRARSFGGERLITLNVNGQPRRVEVMKQETLAWTLRYKLGLTGTKLGCDRAECGACTVLLDDVPHYSCSVLTNTVRGKQVTTIEGLAENESLHKVQQAWLAHQVPQCGYCQSGMIMAAAALLRQIPKPTDAQINDAITNLCRCATYHRIREAIHAAANA
jgi:aerobic-type carbon monoxide dehydrogenase small subunit (CoxS/CutS family)